MPIDKLFQYAQWCIKSFQFFQIHIGAFNLFFDQTGNGRRGEKPDMDNRFIEKPVLNSPDGFPLVNADNDTNPELNRLALKLVLILQRKEIWIHELSPGE